MIDARLEEIREEITRVRREAKQHWGDRNEWPPYVLARYEALKEQARECREQLGETG